MTKELKFDAGSINLRVEHRTFGEDGGPALRVLAELDGKEVEVLRFDCFRKSPHYHYDPYGKNDMHELGKDEVPDPIAWTLEQLRSQLQPMIREAGYDGVAERVDQGAVAAALPELESFMRSA